MKVKELIAQLQRCCDPNSQVYVQLDGEPGPVCSVSDLTGGLIIGGEDDNGESFNDMSGSDDEDESDG